MLDEETALLRLSHLFLLNDGAWLRIGCLNMFILN